MYIDGNSCTGTCPGTKSYNHNYECKSSCPDGTYYVKSEKECVSQCPNGYYISLSDPKHCVDTCLNDGNYIDTQNKKCTNCNDYYKLYNDPNADGKKTCYNQCPSYTYYIYGSKICYYYPPSSNNHNCYFKENDYSVCYSSCIQIGTSYKYVDNNICYENFNCGDRYYYVDTQDNNIIKCIPEEGIRPSQNPNYINVCVSREYYYLRGKECISGCNENEYIIFPTNNSIYLGITILGACCPNPDCNSSYPYYSDDHILRSSCSYKKVTSNFIKTRNGNCLKTCPSEYPFESSDSIYCVSGCGNGEFIYYIGNTKKCVSSCKNGRSEASS